MFARTGQQHSRFVSYRDKAPCIHLMALWVALSSVGLSLGATDVEIDAWIRTAVSLSEAGDQKTAFESLSKLVREQPNNERANMEFGLVCVALGEVGHAQLAFERVLQVNPRNDRARLEYARVLMAQGQYPLAEAEFRKVLAGNPPENVRDNIRSYLTQLSRQSKTVSFFGRLEGGALHDSNVNLGPDADTVAIRPTEFGSVLITSLELDKASRANSSDGFFASASGVLSYDLGNPGGWQAAGEGSYYRNWLASEDSPYETESYRTAVSLQTRGLRSMLNVPVDYSRVERGGEGLLDMKGAGLSYTMAPGRTPTRSYNFETSLASHDYVSLDLRDAVHFSGATSARQMLPGGALAAIFGLGAHRHTADADIYSYTGYEGLLGMEAKPSSSTKFSVSLRYTSSSYDEREVLAEADRTDNVFLLNVGATRTFSENVGLTANYQHSDNDSNVELYKYNRDTATIGVFAGF